MKLLAKFRSPTHRWKIYILIGVIVYFIVINQFIHVRPDHIFLALVIFSFVLGKERAKRFLLDWSPFIFFWIAYDMMRGVADSVLGRINVVLPYRVELAVFGPFFGGKVPAFWFQQFRQAYEGTLLRNIVSLVAANFYTLHFAAPLLLGWVFWHTLEDRKTFYRFVYTLTVLDGMALLTFMLYPAAPPWYVYNYGFTQPALGASYWGMSAGSLLDVDRLLGVHFFATLWDAYNANHFAAIPSLHGAYPMVIAFFAYRRLRRGLVPLVAYPVLTWFAAVYLNQHYIIDLIIGAGYAFIAYQIVERLLYPTLFAPFLEKGERETTGIVRPWPLEKSEVGI